MHLERAYCVWSILWLYKAIIVPKTKINALCKKIKEEFALHALYKALRILTFDSKVILVYLKHVIIYF